MLTDDPFSLQVLAVMAAEVSYSVNRDKRSPTVSQVGTARRRLGAGTGGRAARAGTALLNYCLPARPP